MKYKKERDIKRPNNRSTVTCGDGICLFQNPEYAENSAGILQIIGFDIKILLMCRVSPTKIKYPENFENIWILNPSPDEVRPYRILIKKESSSPLACANQIIIANNPIPYIIDSILSNDKTFYNLSEAKSKNYLIFKERGLTNEKLAIKVYSSKDNKYINNYLRTKNVKLPDEENEIYNELELKSWIYCLHSALKHLNKNVYDDKIVYRGVNCKFPDNIKIGEKFYFREFCSTSLNKNAAKMYADDGTLFIIKIKNNGTNKHQKYCLDISNLSNFEDEEEILISCHCAFLVTNIIKGVNNDMCDNKYFDEVYLDCEGYNFDI